MPAINEVDYLRRRTAEERARANRCEQKNIRRVHLDLAALYAQRLDDIERGQSSR